jgi:hypothetical protein
LLEHRSKTSGTRLAIMTVRFAVLGLAQPYFIRALVVWLSGRELVNCRHDGFLGYDRGAGSVDEAQGAAAYDVKIDFRPANAATAARRPLN